MCGIAGIYNYFSNNPIDLPLLSNMTGVISHRGPDDEGFYNCGSIGLGMRRLSIIDVEGGHQPIHNEDQTIWLVFNGEIYNFLELRRQLIERGHCFYTQSDSEVIVHAYEEWGVDVFSHLNGMFGIALWDSVQRRLIMARDHFGIKPLYYLDDGKRLLFGSELKTILCDRSVSRNVDEAALNLYLTFRFVPSPYTLLSGIHKIPPGHYLICNESGPRLHRYAYSTPALPSKNTEADLVATLRHHLEIAIQRQMISDVPVGALLSGGVDSTTIVTLMTRFAHDPVHTFTVGFAEQGDFNELDEARVTAKRLGTLHHEIVLTTKDYIGFWPKAVWHLEEPVVTPSALPMYYVSQLAQRHVKVVLTGQGADEPWAGYRRYKGEQWAAAYQRIPASLRQQVISPIVESLPRSEGLKRAIRSLGEEDACQRFVKVYSVFTENQKKLLLKQPLISTESELVNSVQMWQRDVAHLDGLSQMMYVDSRFSLSDDLLLYGDKMSMAVSLEARVPMLDLDLMAFVEGLPSHWRLHGRTHKYLYRKAIAAWLPQDVLQRPKRGFDTPMDKWLGKNLQDYLRQLWFGADSACKFYFNLSYLEKLLVEHASGRFDHRRQLFSLISFELWHRIFVNQQSPESLAGL